MVLIKQQEDGTHGGNRHWLVQFDARHGAVGGTAQPSPRLRRMAACHDAVRTRFVDQQLQLLAVLCHIAAAQDGRRRASDGEFVRMGRQRLQNILQ